MPGRQLDLTVPLPVSIEVGKEFSCCGSSSREKQEGLHSIQGVMVVRRVGVVSRGLKFCEVLLRLFSRRVLEELYEFQSSEFGSSGVELTNLGEELDILLLCRFFRGTLNTLPRVPALGC